MKTYASLTLFFLRSFLFNPLNNPVFVVLAILLVFFFIEGSLDKYHIALMLYLSVLGHCFIGNIFRSQGEDENSASTVPITRHFQALPVSGKDVYISYFVSSLLYAILLSTVLVLLLVKFMKLPDLADIEFYRSVTPDGDTITTVTGFTFTPRMIPRFVSFVLEKSLFFDVMTRSRSAPLFIIVYFIFAFTYVSVFQVYKVFHHSRMKMIAGLFHRLPLGVYVSFAIFFLSEVMLSQRETGIGTRYILDHLDQAAIFLLGTALITVLSTLVMSLIIMKQLRGAPAS